MSADLTLRTAEKGSISVSAGETNEPAMSGKKGYEIDFLVFVATVTIACFAVASHLQPRMPKAARGRSSF
jgi:hypothetical protein